MTGFAVGFRFNSVTYFKMFFKLFSRRCFAVFKSFEIVLWGDV